MGLVINDIIGKYKYPFYIKYHQLDLQKILTWAWSMDEYLQLHYNLLKQNQ